ncbi:MAG: PQQ-dependent sugar dehydrogenase [Saprospiraceae bacterium]
MRQIFTPLLLLICCCLSLAAQPTLSLQPYITGLNSPIYLTNAGDGTNRLFIIERAGRIKIYDQNTDQLLSSNYLNISGSTTSTGERGLLGMAFHPNYAANGYFYVNYTNNSGNTVISRFTRSAGNANQADPTSELIILTVNQPASNHNAGDLAFGPDGYLWIPLGDGGNNPGTRSQDPLNLLGKVLRIDVDNPSGGLNYGIPTDNPFVGDAGTRDEIWASGLRNPFRFSFDGNALWIADVGQNKWEEVNYIPDVTTGGGYNFGWQCYEGPDPYFTTGCEPIANYYFPDFEYFHNANGGYSITGGRVYRGSQYTTLTGTYIMADYASDNFWQLRPQMDGSLSSDRQNFSTDITAVAFGEDEARELYVVSLMGGIIYQIQATPALPVDFTDWRGELTRQKEVQLTWATARERGADYYEVQRSVPGGAFAPIGRVAATGDAEIESRYNFTDPAPRTGLNYYRLRQVDRDGSEEYTPIISICSGSDDTPVSGTPRFFPNPVTAGSGQLELPADWDAAADVNWEITDFLGRRIATGFLAGANRVGPLIDITLPGGQSTGYYVLRAWAGDRSGSLRLLVRD